ncbi:MAG: hypothetical protein KatS3mg003_0738 [Candidatus Nitrosocaldaceae archaeon]|nr:MAG: hypothetical protein KatS3mg003_0738 [Candidatus Nitrosocaldaceae archaeon]
MPQKHLNFLLSSQREYLLLLVKMLEKYKKRKYNQMNNLTDRLLKIYNKEIKTKDSWYAKDNELTLEGHLCLLCQLLDLPLYAVLVLVDAYLEYERATDILNSNDDMLIHVTPVANVNGKVCFTLGKNILALAIMKVYRYERYYEAVDLFVKRGFLVRIDKITKGRIVRSKRFYAFTTRAIHYADLLSVTGSKITDEIINSILIS